MVVIIIIIIIIIIKQTNLQLEMDHSRELKQKSSFGINGLKFAMRLHF